MEKGLEAVVCPNSGLAETRSEARCAEGVGGTAEGVPWLLSTSGDVKLCNVSAQARYWRRKPAPAIPAEPLHVMIVPSSVLFRQGVEQVGSDACLFDEGRCKLDVGTLKRGRLEVLGERNATVTASVELLKGARDQ